MHFVFIFIFLPQMFFCLFVFLLPNRILTQGSIEFQSPFFILQMYVRVNLGDFDENKDAIKL